MACVLQTTKFLAAAVNDQAEPRRIVVAWITPVVAETLHKWRQRITKEQQRNADAS